MNIKLELPWFDQQLNPNRGAHWRVKAAARKKQKENAFWIAQDGPKPTVQEKYNLKIIFYPPDKRKRDIDNCIAAIKGALDGIALAWDVDDRSFRFKDPDFGDVVKYGKITIEVTDG